MQGFIQDFSLGGWGGIMLSHNQRFIYIIWSGHEDCETVKQISDETNYIPYFLE